VRDPRIWRLSAASSLMIIGQVGVTSLLVLYLYDERGWSAAAAAVALGTTQLGAAVARAAAGRWSDLRGERIEPFRRLATTAGLLLLAATALSPAPAAVAVPVLIAGGIAAMSWNGLSFTAAAEISGRRQAGTAMGIQNTAMRLVAAGVPVALGALASEVSWAMAFAVMGVTPLLARALLEPLVEDERRRGRERSARLRSLAAEP
jgi:sugar phosphate permease